MLCCWKKHIPTIILFLGVTLLPCLTFASTPFSQKLKKDALNEAFADCFTQVFEQGAGIPSSGIAQMSGYFSEGDYSSGLMKAAELGGSTIIEQVPGMGTIKFAASLEVAIIKLGKAYLDSEMVDKFWGEFQQLSETDQEDFLDGKYVAEIDAALGGYYTQRNVENLRDLFNYYQQEKEKSRRYMEDAEKVLKDLNEAGALRAPVPNEPGNGATISQQQFPSQALEWATLHGNIFRVELRVAGQSFFVDKKLPANEIHAFYSLPLSAFGLDWEQALNQDDGALELKWRVMGARYDTTGLIKTLVGADYTATDYNIVALPEKDAIKTSPWQSLTIVKDFQLEISIDTPADGFETSAETVGVTANISSPYGTIPDDIEAVGFLVNDAGEYTTLNEESFSIEAQLNMGVNRLQAGIRTDSGNYIFSDLITVTRTEREETTAWVLREIVPRDMCANYSHQCYDLDYVMAEGAFSQNGNGKRGGPCYCEKGGNCGPWSGSGGYTVPPAVLIPGEELSLSVELKGTEHSGYHSSMRYCVYRDAENMSFDGQGYNTGDQASYCRGKSYGMPYLWPDAYPTPKVIPEGSMTLPIKPGGGLVIDGSFSSNQCSTGYRYVYTWMDNYTETTEEKTYYDSGALKTVYTWRDGLQNGPAMRYYENGVVAARVTYLNGLPEGTARYYYEDGTREKSANYVKGEANGPAYYYDENGDLHAMITYVDEVKHGSAKEYYPDGTLQREYTYVDGTVEGTVIEYNQDGSIKNEYIY